MMRRIAGMCMLLTPLAWGAQARMLEADWSRNGLFPMEQEGLSLGVVQGRQGEKVHFFDVRDWVGTWSNGLSTIRITSSKTGGGLRMSSSLRWEGGAMSNGEPIVHFGAMQAALNVQGAKASATENDCQVALSRIGHYLVADDKGSCGGMNVRHTDVYLRRPR